ncbi:hypothetical protein [Phocaeicola dorei]|uniref:hypothetical protein n=1 Tax=Phocaeicola dorei TaxID=357276 RepID=UPI00189CB21B|nr:hypothetical protein [Phocaeicola dorei]
MLSEKVKSLFSQKGYISLSKEERASYEKALIDLGIPLESSFAEFNLSTIGPTFTERGYELYNVCWFKIYSNDLDYAIESAHDELQLPDEYLPLDNFEAEEGFFYNRNTEEVLKLSIGPDLEDFQSGILHPQWKDFNSFLEWFFEV